MGELHVYNWYILFKFQWNHNEEMMSIALKICRKYFFQFWSTSRHIFQSFYATIPSLAVM
jgi:hypothetical protein